MAQRLVLLILDGWGIGNNDVTNPIALAKPETIERIRTTYRIGSLQASGIAVGLPWEEVGNSEVGHLTIGAGKVLYQHLPKISLSIKDGSFFTNEVLVNAMDRANRNGAAVNLVGLLTEGTVHAAFEHVEALVKLAANRNVTALNLHLITDGKDSSPRSAATLVDRLEQVLRTYGIGRISSLSGRFYALDREEHWDRIEKAYRAITGTAPLTNDPHATLNATYQKHPTEEYLEPITIGPTPSPIASGDSIIFFNFREDGLRQLATAFVNDQFDEFERAPLTNLSIVTMTRYADDLAVPVAFPTDNVEQPLGRVISENGLAQLRVAETEKYAHVTFFFNGYREAPFENEYRVLIPSKNVARPDIAPEMMANEVASRISSAVAEGGFDFILGNLANPDIIAHTGNVDATMLAISAVDMALKQILETCLAHNVTLLITADHGNAERMRDPHTGRIETRHDPSLVPCYLVRPSWELPKQSREADLIESEAAGILADVAPTVLELMELAKPTEMTGTSLVSMLR